MTNYTRQIETAKRLIAAKGQSVVWRVLENSQPADSEQPWNPGEVIPSDRPVHIVFLPPNRQNYEFLRMMTGTEVPAGKTMGLMAAVDFSPSIKDTVIRGGEVYSVSYIDVLSPDGAPVLYTIGFDR